MDRTDSFGYWLRRQRKSLDLTQAELAERISCSLNLIQKIEHDERRPSRLIATRLADALALPPAERERFIRVARAERRADQLAMPKGMAAPFPPFPPPSPPPRRTNLPAQPTALLGRERELADVAALLRRPGARLATLVGPGGVGKTRLGLQVAEELRGDFADGVYLVDLAPIRDPDLVPSAVAHALGLRELDGQQPAAALGDYLRERQLLLLVDNFEQVIDAAPFVAALLATAAQVKLLATSREALRLRGEKIVAVQPLALPERGRLPPLERLAQYAAVELFVERAANAQTSFRLSEENAPAVAEICARLEGLPLAIELAAAGVTHFAPAELLARLSQRLQLPALGPRDLPARQRTMRSAVAWSYELLGEAERALFRRLGVFAGGWTLAAAEYVAGHERAEGAGAEAPRQATAAGAFLNEHVQLVQKSLVVAVAQQVAGPRFRMLEPIREYASELLAAAGEEATLRARHLAYFLDLAGDVNALRDGRASSFAGELDNLRAALDWAEQHAVMDGLRLAGAAWRYCLRFGHSGEFAARLRRLLAHPEAAAATPERAQALSAAAALLAWHDFEQARALAEESLAIQRAIGDRSGEAGNLLLLHSQIGYRGNFATARSAIHECIAMYRGLEDRAGLADALMQATSFARWDDYAQTRAALEEALAIYREIGDLVSLMECLEVLGGLEIHMGQLARARAALEECQALQQQYTEELSASVLMALGGLAVHEGQYGPARNMLEASLELCQASGDRLMSNWALVKLGYVALETGDLERAHTVFSTVTRRFEAADVVIGVIYALEGIASLSARTGNTAHAVQLFAWAEATRAAVGDLRPPVLQPPIERDLAALRAQLDATGFEEAWAAGGALAKEEALALALS
jgi:predicted ATPase/transcriptional regulator with XRE-family HTH domain